MVDTGPIVALLDARDSYHSWARDTFADIEPPLATCDAVLAEACFLVRRLPGGPVRVLDLVHRGVLELTFHLHNELQPVSRLMQRYASVPMSLADACLVRMSELEPAVTILTLDTDFRVYRRNRRHIVPTLVPRR